jgi:hypothetical protein
MAPIVAYFLVFCSLECSVIINYGVTVIISCCCMYYPQIFKIFLPFLKMQFFIYSKNDKNKKSFNDM